MTLLAIIFGLVLFYMLFIPWWKNLVQRWDTEYPVVPSAPQSISSGQTLMITDDSEPQSPTYGKD